jgi:hypothetical protein
MKDFKFFQKGTLDNPQLLGDELTRLTASFNDDTPEGHMSRRMLYHTNRGQYDRLRHPNNEMEQYFLERGLLSQMIENSEIPASTIPSQSHDIGMSNYTPPEGEPYYQRFFPQVTVTKVNPKWWMKIKIVLQESWLYDPIGVVVVSALTTIVTIIGIAKLLNAF